jgi:predicted AlkP superfamily pyrophosphatase or phosphodiesterase
MLANVESYKVFMLRLIFQYSLIRSGAAIPFTAHATPPTVTMPRVKALTTGSVPSFLDLILNFAESDTSSSLATQDTWLAQLRAQPHGSLVFYGDDTWLKLFPGDFFARAEGTSSFFVSVSNWPWYLYEMIEFVAEVCHFLLSRISPKLITMLRVMCLLSW